VDLEGLLNGLVAVEKLLSDLAPISIRVAKGTKIWKKGRKK